jgi:sucrose-6F-phosphate phosphohydrolase
VGSIFVPERPDFNPSLREDAKVEKQRKLLATDMDGTVIPLDREPQRKTEIQELRAALEASEGVLLAYVTGRGLELASKGIRQFDLPIPDFFVGDVGTSLYRSTQDGFEVDVEYARRMKEAMGGLDFKEVQESMKPLSHLLLEPHERQTEFKLSFRLPGDQDNRPTIAAVREHLENLGGRVQVVYSVGAPSGVGLLDLLPVGGGKEHALRYLQEITGIEEEHVVYAGDSGNDLAAMLGGVKAILVGNAGKELRTELEEKGRERGILSKIHFSSSPFAKGVLEGCRHFGIL